MTNLDLLINNVELFLHVFLVYSLILFNFFNGLNFNLYSDDLGGFFKILSILNNVPPLYLLNYNNNIYNIDF